MGLLENRVAVVTGAGRGVGRAVAIAFAAEGAAVGLAARTGEEITSAADEIREKGGRALAVPTDVTRQADVDHLFATVEAELGPVDILVNNAGTLGPMGRLWDTDPSEWLQAFDANVITMVRCARAALPGMVERRRGKIVNVGSVAAYHDGWVGGFNEMAAYAATKAAVVRLTECLADQVKHFAINVNCVGVGADTRLGHEAGEKLARLRGSPLPPSLEDVPVEERTLPDENVGAFLFLSSSLSDHVTGAYFEANALYERWRRGQ